MNSMNSESIENIEQYQAITNLISTTVDNLIYCLVITNMIDVVLFRRRWPTTYLSMRWIVDNPECYFAHVRDHLAYKDRDGLRGYRLHRKKIGPNNLVRCSVIKGLHIIHTCEGDYSKTSKVCISKALDHYESVLKERNSKGKSNSRNRSDKG